MTRPLMDANSSNPLEASIARDRHVRRMELRTMSTAKLTKLQERLANEHRLAIINKPAVRRELEEVNLELSLR